MSNDLLINTLTKPKFINFLNAPSHSLIIVGAEGSGKLTVAKYLARELLVANDEADLAKYHFMLIEPDKGTISINDIRSTAQFMKLKSIGKGEIQRVLIIADSEKMTLEAQNAFLKLLEEPPDDTVIILTTTRVNLLLPTIVSRAQQIKLSLPDKQSTIYYFVELGYAELDVMRAYLLSEGRIGLMTSMLNGPDVSGLVSTVDEAKRLLTKYRFDRLVEVSEISRDKDRLPELLDALAIVCQAGLKASSDKSQFNQIKRWHHSLNSVIQARDQLVQNPNAKLLMTNLMLKL